MVWTLWMTGASIETTLEGTVKGMAGAGTSC